MSNCRFQPRARFTCGASAVASRWLRAGTTSTRVRSAPSRSRASTTLVVSWAQAGTAVDTCRSSAVFLPTHPTEKTSAMTSATRFCLVRLRGTPAGVEVAGTASSAANRAAGAKSSASRSTFVPTGEGIRYVRTVPAAYTTAPHRSTRQPRGARVSTTRPITTGGQIRARASTARR